MTDQKSQQVIVEEETDRSRLAAIDALARSFMAAEEEFDAHHEGDLPQHYWENETAGASVPSSLDAFNRRFDAQKVLMMELEAAIEAGTFDRINNGKLLT